MTDVHTSSRRILDNWLAHPPTEAYLDRGCAERIVERELFGGEHILVGETTLVWRGGIPGTA